MTVLGAILLNPPATGGTSTRRHLQVAADVLGCDSVRIANLFAVSTASVLEINQLGQNWTGWQAAQADLSALIADADVVLVGWGVSGLHGSAAKHRRMQVRWVVDTASAGAKDHVWTLNGEPRHPSRWHQYVSDRHGRASGASMHERLAMVLRSVPVGTLCLDRVEVHATRR